MAHVKRIIYEDTYVNIPEEPWVRTESINGVETEVTYSYAHSNQMGVLKIGIMDTLPSGNGDGEVDIHSDTFFLECYSGSDTNAPPKALLTIFSGSPTVKFSNGLVWVIESHLA